jgi:hypothetical protein
MKKKSTDENRFYLVGLHQLRTHWQQCGGLRKCYWQEHGKIVKEQTEFVSNIQEANTRMIVG